jgi:hypothetical protein
MPRKEDLYEEKATYGGPNRAFDPPPPKPKTKREIEEEQEREWKGPFGWSGDGYDGFR